jgi:hypothetical protein
VCRNRLAAEWTDIVEPVLLGTIHKMHGIAGIAGIDARSFGCPAMHVLGL